MSKTDFYIVDIEGQVKIIEAPRLTKPDGLIRRAPTGIRPGDEECVSWFGGKKIKIDWRKHDQLKKQRKLDKHRATEKANEGPGVWGTIKGWFGG